MSDLLFLATTMLSPFCFSWRDWVSIFTILQSNNNVMMTTKRLTTYLYITNITDMTDRLTWTLLT